MQITPCCRGGRDELVAIQRWAVMPCKFVYSWPRSEVLVPEEKM